MMENNYFSLSKIIALITLMVWWVS